MQIKPVGHVPSPRRAAASCVVEDRWLVIHGGFDGSKCLGDTHMFDPVSCTWTAIVCEGYTATSSAVLPVPRALHTLVLIGHGLLAYGGACSERVLSSALMLHNRALTAGVLLSLQDEAQQHGYNQLECKLAQAQEAFERADQVAGRALVEKQV